MQTTHACGARACGARVVDLLACLSVPPQHMPRSQHTAHACHARCMLAARPHARTHACSHARTYSATRHPHGAPAVSMRKTQHGQRRDVFMFVTCSCSFQRRDGMTESASRPAPGAGCTFRISNLRRHAKSARGPHAATTHANQSSEAAHPSEPARLPAACCPVL